MIYRPFLVGTKRVTWECGRFVVRNATTDRIVASTPHQGLAEGLAVRISDKEHRKP